MSTKIVIISGYFFIIFYEFISKSSIDLIESTLAQLSIHCPPNSARGADENLCYTHPQLSRGSQHHSALEKLEHENICSLPLYTKHELCGTAEIIP